MAEPMTTRGTPRKYVAPGATVAERLAHHGWTERLVRPELGPCHEWNGHIGRGGYGRMADGGGRARDVHRIVLAEKLGGPIPDGVFALHHCDNRPCMNAAHIYAGTRADNLADAIRRNRIANGERTGNHKLSDAQVAEIRAKYTGERGQLAPLAAEYGVTASMVSLIGRGLSRRDETYRPE